MGFRVDGNKFITNIGASKQRRFEQSFLSQREQLEILFSALLFHVFSIFSVK